MSSLDIAWGITALFISLMSYAIIYDFLNSRQKQKTKLKQEEKEKNKHTIFVNAVKEYLKYKKQPVFYCYNEIVWLCAMSAYANALERFVKNSEGFTL